MFDSLTTTTTTIVYGTPTLQCAPLASDAAAIYLCTLAFPWSSSCSHRQMLCGSRCSLYHQRCAQCSSATDSCPHFYSYVMHSMFCVPQNVGNGVSNATTRFLAWLYGFSPTLEHLLLAYLPSLILVGISSLLLLLLYAAGRYLTQPKSGLRRERDIMAPSFLYLLFNVLILPTLVRPMPSLTHPLLLLPS